MRLEFGYKTFWQRLYGLQLSSYYIVVHNRILYQNKIIIVYILFLQEINIRIAEYDALKKRHIFQSMHI